ncbi:copper amine oxidase N-terminal domain-containing protein [Paenibacillus ginsengarvi]|uniref:copper amine oxidase N-terminal domain-containing protein n=1 Tax=Paenibacillus ginsengarvi TaxID=400777 RepID=UPI00131588AD|nr:copper amine oxidase N-terminal domain-containing protein [Paenibacillus ginsengarvi]
MFRTWNVGYRLSAKAASLMTVLSLVIAMVCQTGAAAAPKEISIYYKDQLVTFQEAPPILMDGRTLVPFRSLLETLGFEVDWRSVGGVSKATGTKEGLVIELTIDNKTALVNGRKVELDVPAQIVEGRTMVPLRFVSEESGYEVAYADTGDKIVIRISDKADAVTKDGTAANRGNDIVEPYVLKGVAVDSAGRPIRKATIYADNQLLYNSNEIAVTDANGRYRIELSRMATTWNASGEAAIELNGVSSTVELTPDNDDPFAGNTGAIRNFVMQTATGSVIFHMADLWDPADITLPPPNREDVELTLEPVGESAGGAGKTYVGHGGVTNNGFGIKDVPIGRYKITARLLPKGKPAQNLLVRILDEGEFAKSLVTDFENTIGAFYRIEIELKLP